MAGDGHRLKIGTTAMTGTTVSKSLALNMFDIANVLGLRPSINYGDPKPSHGVKARKRRYNVRTCELNPQDNKGVRCDVDSGAMWRVVESVESVTFSGWVYNLEVDGDNSYVAEGIGVHNCVYNMAALMYQIIWNMQFGYKRAIQVSPISGYRWNARSPSSGSYVGGAATWLAGTGLLPTNRDEVKAILQPHGINVYHPNTGWSNSFQDNWKQTARFFRIDEWFKVSTVEAWVSALLNGFVCGGGRDGHAICHCGLTMNGGTLYSIYCNSWGSWGSTLETVVGDLRSFGLDSEAKIRTMVGRDAWAVRSIVVPDFMLAT